MEDRHTVLGSFWHESINNIVPGSINPLGGFFFLSFLSFFSLRIIVGGDVSHLGMIVVLYW